MITRYLTSAQTRTGPTRGPAGVDPAVEAERLQPLHPHPYVPTLHRDIGHRRLVRAAHTAGPCPLRDVQPVQCRARARTRIRSPSGSDPMGQGMRCPAPIWGSDTAWVAGSDGRPAVVDGEHGATDVARR